MIITTLLATLIIIFFSLAGLIFFGIGYYQRIYSTKNDAFFEKNFQSLYDEEPILEETEQTKEEKQNKINASINFFHYIEQSLIKDLFVTIEIHIIFGVFIFILLIATWLTPKSTFWAFSLSLLIGVSTQTIYFLFVTTTTTVKNLPFFSNQTKEQSLIFAYGNGILLSILLVIENLISILLISLILNFFYFKSDRNLENYTKLSIGFVGYAFGSLLTGIFFRESLSIVGRGIQIASDLIIRNDFDLVEVSDYISQTLKVVSIASSEINNSIINFLDAKIIISMFCIMPFMTLGYSEEIRTNENFWGIILTTHIIISINLLGTVLIGLLILCIKQEDIITYIANAMRWQVIASSIFSLLLLAGLSGLYVVPDEFISIGNEQFPYFYTQFISSKQIILCSILGLVAQLILLIYFEYRTSHGYFPTRNLSTVAENAPTLNIMYAYYLGYGGQFFPIFIVSLLIYISYTLAGLVGLLSALSGIIINIMILLSILFVGGVNHDGIKCGLIQQIHPGILEIMKKIAWASRNYNIYVRVVIVSSTLIIGIILLSATVINTQLEIRYLWTSSMMIGVIIGTSLAFYNRGMSFRALQIIIQEAVNLSFFCNYQLSTERILQSRRGGDEREEQDALISYIENYFPEIHQNAMNSFLFNFTITTIVILCNGLLFGIQAAIGQGIAYLFNQIVSIFISLLTGSSLRNSKLFYQKQEYKAVSSNSQKFASHLYGDVQGTALEESLATPAVYYIFYNLMLTIIGYEVFIKTGWLKA